MAIVKSWKGVCVNFAGGNNKWWKAELHDNGDVITRYGKIVNGAEDQGQNRVFNGAGQSFYDKKIREKMNKTDPNDRYVECKTLDNVSVSSAPRMAQSSLLEIAKKQIQAVSADTWKLIEYLVKANIHTITSQTSIQYNKDTGLFQTPMGIVTQDAIDDARNLLSEIGLFVSKRDFGNEQFMDVAQKYFRLIPKDMGRITRFKTEDLFPDFNSVSAQDNILNSLETSLKMALASDKPIVDQKEEPIFNLKLDVIEDRSEIKRIEDLFAKTKNSIHAASRLRVAKVYHVEIGHMREAFEARGRKLGNVWELWHGTRIANLLSIMKSGYYIPPSNAPHVTGRMFSNGMYFSDQSTKSLNYAMGMAPGQRGGFSAECFMFLNDVAMGNYYVPKGPTSSPPPSGHHSYFAQAGKSGVMNNEMIVPNVYQCCPTFLVQFE